MAHKFTATTTFTIVCSTCNSGWPYASPEQLPGKMTCPHCNRTDFVHPADPLHDQQVMVRLTPQRAACGD